MLSTDITSGECPNRPARRRGRGKSDYIDICVITLIFFHVISIFFHIILIFFHIILIWLQWYDHNNPHKLNKSVARASVLNGCLKSQQPPDHIILIWSHWYDHINVYRLMESIALTSVLDNCSESQQGLCYIRSIWSNWYYHIALCHDSKLWLIRLISLL